MPKLIAVIVIAAAAFVLWRATRAEEPSAEPAPEATKDVPADTPSPTKHRERPTLEGSEVTLTADVRAPTYENGEPRVRRDHRSSGVRPTIKPPTRPSASKRSAVERATIGRIRNVVRPEVQQCVADSDAQLPKGTRLQVVLYTDIADGVASASGLEITGNAPPEIEDCVRAKMTAVKVDVPEAADVEGYPFNFPFDLSRLR